MSNLLVAYLVLIKKLCKLFVLARIFEIERAKVLILCMHIFKKTKIIILYIICK